MTNLCHCAYDMNMVFLSASFYVSSEGNAVDFASEKLRQLGLRCRSILLLAGSILFVQIVFWLAVNPLLFAPAQRPEMIKVDTAAIAKIDAPDANLFEIATFKPVELPASDCCSPGYRLLRTDFTLETVPESGLALIPSIGADNFHIRLNGGWVRQEGRLTLPDVTYHGNLKTILYLPPAQLKIGSNRLEYVVTRGSIPYFDFGKPMLAPYADTTQKLAHRNFILNDYAIISYGIGALAAALAFILMIRSEQKLFAFWTFILLATWTLRMHYFRWVDPPFSAEWRNFYYFMLTVSIPSAWANLADHWTGRPMRWFAWLAGIVWIGVVLSFVGLLSNTEGAYDRAVSITNGAGIVLAILGVARFLWHFFRVPDDRYWETALFILCITLMGVDYYQQLTTGNSSGFLQTSLPILIIAFPVAFLARNIRLFRSMNEFNTLLTSQLQQRETELAENYARQGELLRRETLVAERQRLMRDMHDGIGGQLMSLLFASRRKQLPQAEMTESLQAVIDELRLVIDSLDTVGETLTTALAGFRSRVEPKLSTAGIELRWSNTLPDTKNSLGPREVLQIFRIVQEAVTNVIKHAGSPTLDIAIGPFPDDAGYIVIRISDAGVGQSETASTGHGLQNMAERAKSIGAALTTDVTESGRTVSLKIPISDLGDGQAMAQ